MDPKGHACPRSNGHHAGWTSPTWSRPPAVGERSSCSADRLELQCHLPRRGRPRRRSACRRSRRHRWDPGHLQAATWRTPAVRLPNRASGAERSRRIEIAAALGWDLVPETVPNRRSARRRLAAALRGGRLRGPLLHDASRRTIPRSRPTATTHLLLRPDRQQHRPQERATACWTGPPRVGDRQRPVASMPSSSCAR